jgi:hypothetical protein
MYPEDEPEPAQIVEGASPAWGVTLGALLIGLLIASGIALVVHFIVAGFIPANMLDTTAKIILVFGSLAGALLGGYVAAGLAKRNALTLGGAVGFLSLPGAILLATRWIEVTPELFFSLPWLVIGMFIVLAGVAGGWLNQNFTQSDAWKEKWKVRGWEDLLYQDLLRRVRFNGSAADRLIDYERKQDPQAPRYKLIQSAIERWERDNR